MHTCFHLKVLRAPFDTTGCRHLPLQVDVSEVTGQNALLDELAADWASDVGLGPVHRHDVDPQPGLGHHVLAAVGAVGAGVIPAHVRDASTELFWGQAGLFGLLRFFVYYSFGDVFFIGFKWPMVEMKPLQSQCTLRITSS